MTENEQWIWVARKPCGCVEAASVDDQNQDDLKRDIGDWMMRGLVVTHEGGLITLGSCPEHLKPATVKG